jgi:hypothetical protein
LQSENKKAWSDQMQRTGPPLLLSQLRITRHPLSEPRFCKFSIPQRTTLRAYDDHRCRQSRNDDGVSFNASIDRYFRTQVFVLKHRIQQGSLRGSKDLCIYSYAMNRHEAEVGIWRLSLTTIPKHLKANQDNLKQK